MALSKEQKQQLESLLAQTDAIFRDAFERFVDTINSPEIFDLIVEELQAGRVDQAIEIVRNQAVAMGAAVPQAILFAGNAAAAEAIAELADPRVGFAFDPAAPRAAALMRQETLGFVANFAETQVQAVREELAVALEAGEGAINTARRIRDVAGLAPSQARAVRNFERLLRGGSAELTEALTRDVRDRRFDGSIRRARRTNKPLTNDQITRMVDRYRFRYRQLRGETIARTETTRVTSMARQETFRQFMEVAGIGHNRMIRIWNATDQGTSEGGRTRDWHADMDGQERAINVPFKDGKRQLVLFPGDPAAPADTVINCRCVLTMRIADKSPE